jgi:hypothetical protein
VGIDGVDGDEETVGDLFAEQALLDELQDFALAACEVGVDAGIGLGAEVVEPSRFVMEDLAAQWADEVLVRRNVDDAEGEPELALGAELEGLVLFDHADVGAMAIADAVLVQELVMGALLGRQAKPEEEGVDAAAEEFDAVFGMQALVKDLVVVDVMRIGIETEELRKVVRRIGVVPAVQVKDGHGAVVDLGQLLQKLAVVRDAALVKCRRVELLAGQQRGVVLTEQGEFFHDCKILINQYSPGVRRVIALGSAPIRACMIQAQLLRTPFRPLLVAACLLLAGLGLAAQSATGSIRGVVTDLATGQPLGFATVKVTSTDPPAGAFTDSVGRFRITGLALGRHDVEVSMLGYQPVVQRAVLVSAGKATDIEFGIQEQAVQMDDVVIQPKDNTGATRNSMATVSARTLSVEEARRYAGGFDDPARLASAFPGVASNVSNNGIVVRGNAPKFLQWKMEGVEIPNPNHFADLSAFGGGGLTALSAQLLANSDFYTGAFPGEYTNALSGVFDIGMRTGNADAYEHTFQVGVIGVDLASEGPIRRGSGASYIFNYRYSTLALMAPLLPESGGGVKYQDLAFKVNVPTKKAGVFSLWAIGLADRSGQVAKLDSMVWRYDNDRDEQAVRQYMGAAGISHKTILGSRSNLKTTAAATINGLDLRSQRLDPDLLLQDMNRIQNSSTNYVLSSQLTTKYNARLSQRSGITLTGLAYNLSLQQAPVLGQPMTTLVDADGLAGLLSAYSSLGIALGNRVTANVGLASQYFSLSGDATVEPRAGIKWQPRADHTLGLAYGLHSRLERLNYYFSTDASGAQPNRDLGFSKAHHLVGSYAWQVSDRFQVKAEAYWQGLFAVPVIADSSFSFINLQNDWFFNQALANAGNGRNIGLDISLEQGLQRGFYWMLTASVFDARYQGGDGIWRDTRFNRNYLVNLLGGKEWQLGKKKRDLFGLNLRASYQGGDRYTPFNTALSQAAQDVVYDHTQPFSQQFPASFVLHASTSYRMNRDRINHEIALKIINLTGFAEFYGYQFNRVTQQVDAHREAIFFPNLSYKVEF